MKKKRDGPKAKNKMFDWTLECQHASNSLKMPYIPILELSKNEYVFTLDTETSCNRRGVLLPQVQDDQEDY